jgi:hypothetical protein
LETVNIRKATFNDFAVFKLHPKNIEEVQVLSEIDPDTCLAILWDHAVEKNIYTVNDKPTCLFGFLPNNEFWLFFHEGINSLPLSFFKISKKYIADCKKVHGMIYYKNTFALEWVKFIGFEIKPAKNKLFYDFWKRKED